MKVNDSFILREIYGKKILMPIKTNEVGDEPILLNDIGAIIWKMADRVDTVEDLVNELSCEYNLREGSPEQISIQTFIGQLLSLKLIYE